MIDVERLQRLNQLANDLLEHGFAHDREEAVRQADETLKKKSSSSIVSITHMASTPSIDNHANSYDRSKVMHESSSFKEAIQGAQQQGYVPDWNTLYRNLNKKIEDQNSQIQALLAQIKQMDGDITLLKNRPQTVIQQTVRQTPEPSTQAPSNAIPEKQPAAERKPSVAVIDAETGKAIPVREQEHKSPRTGGYSPKDVAIEKMFYSGTRSKG